jgi:hypothetical protein
VRQRRICSWSVSRRSRQLHRWVGIQLVGETPVFRADFVNAPLGFRPPAPEPIESAVTRPKEDAFQVALHSCQQRHPRLPTIREEAVPALFVLPSETWAICRAWSEVLCLTGCLLGDQTGKRWRGPWPWEESRLLAAARRISTELGQTRAVSPDRPRVTAERVPTWSRHQAAAEARWAALARRVGSCGR